ncbi:MFS transporter [Paenibacillus rhizovicinus]|uniref:MFS transporter n=1 Tax=Paenibacillus rhizovicinus TaxID=2704463 RepID=A0A6C0P0V0_9BACL|nr:MFS transporter [Paenibacillus rhizovicinus]QHW32098.1 MFS transporter [Paenibacillus rhizovicinus]
MRKLLILGCLSYLAIGFGHVAVGAVMEQLVLKYGVNYEAGGQLIMNQFLGFLAGVLLAPWLIRRVGRRFSIVLAFVGFAVAETGYALEPDWAVMLGLALIAGFGFGLGETCIGALVIEILEERKASAMSLLEVFFGIGALVLPAAAAWLILQGYWLWTFGSVAALGSVVLALWLLLPLGEAEAYMGKGLRQGGAMAAEVGAGAGVDSGTRAAAETAAGSVEAPKTAKVQGTGYSRGGMTLLLLGAAFFAVYVGLEMSFTNYLPAIMSRKSGLSESAATISLSLYWAAISFGRLFVGRITGRMGYRNFLLVCCLCAAAVFTGLALVDQAAAVIGLIVVTGLAMAGMFAIGLVYVNEAFPDKIDRTTSILISCGGLGGALLPKVTGWLLDSFDVNRAMWQFFACSVIMLLLMGLVSREQGRLKRRRKGLVEQRNG